MRHFIFLIASLAAAFIAAAPLVALTNAEQATHRVGVVIISDGETTITDAA
jgi:hypothetical protein